MNIGNRIIYDQDGEVIAELGEMQGDVLPRKEITELNFIDLEYGAIDYQTHRMLKIDPVTKQPILEEIPARLTEEQRFI
ncbi:hypothetical protein CD798_08595 [Bacillaceae bacterium SAOS 7]|nr:hypothetical protein CD798_08595 [Bacillaceae bacterium SAOS 7]